MSLTTTLANRTIQNFQVTKSTTTYRIYLDAEEDGWFVVTSPDLDPLVTQGENMEEAIKNAYDAVKLILEDKDSNQEDFNLLVVDR
jgi:predicted RNase H-like HicB family nuclease